MAKILSRIAIGFGSLSLVGAIACSAAPPEESEPTGSVESAVCTCPHIYGSMDMTKDPCGKALLAAHCCGGNTSSPCGTTASAVLGTGTTGTAWFYANCPSNVTIPSACKVAPYYADNLGNYFCCLGYAQTGRVWVEFDPNCPGCHQ